MTIIDVLMTAHVECEVCFRHVFPISDGRSLQYDPIYIRRVQYTIVIDWS